MSTVYDIFRNQNQQNYLPYSNGQMNANPMISKLKQFASSLKGNPEQIVRSLLSSGRMSQSQFDVLSQQASQIQGILNINNKGGGFHV